MVLLQLPVCIIIVCLSKLLVNFIIVGQLFFCCADLVHSTFFERSEKGSNKGEGGMGRDGLFGLGVEQG